MHIEFRSPLQISQQLCRLEKLLKLLENISYADSIFVDNGWSSNLGICIIVFKCSSRKLHD